MADHYCITVSAAFTSVVPTLTQANSFPPVCVASKLPELHDVPILAPDDVSHVSSLAQRSSLLPVVLIVSLIATVPSTSPLSSAATQPLAVSLGLAHSLPLSLPTETLRFSQPPPTNLLRLSLLTTGSINLTWPYPQSSFPPPSTAAATMSWPLRHNPMPHLVRTESYSHGFTGVSNGLWSPTPFQLHLGVVLPPSSVVVDS